MCGTFRGDPIRIHVRGADMIVGDLTLDTLKAGLSGLTARRQASEDAVANMETPGYLAKRVSFEDQLASAVSNGEPDSAGIAVTNKTDVAQPNGNNVKVDQEMISLSDTALRQQLLVEAVNAKFRLMRTVIGG